MSRKDIIIISVLVNVAILAVLFMTANNMDDATEHYEISPMIAEGEKTEAKDTPSIALIENKTPEELDRALTGFAPLQSPAQDLNMEDDAIAELDKELAADEKTEDEESLSKSEESSQSFVEVTVKRGDSLEKIAKGNGVAIEELKKANNLKNDKLLVGQVLKVPVKNTADKTKKAAPAVKAAPSSVKSPQAPLKSDSEAEYHVVKVGDNPWKIAKQYHVRVDDLLKLNGMDEEKARNMKVGDKIRVR